LSYRPKVLQATVILRFSQQWKRHALDDAGHVADNRAYVFATLESFRAGLKRREVFVPAGVRTPTPGKVC
jgi:hypothetical protein